MTTGDARSAAASGTARKRDPEEEVPLLPISEYLDRILATVTPLAPQTLPLADAHGCVAAVDVRAPRDLPPFASSAMDGYAVLASDISGATDDQPVTLAIAGEVLIGHPADVAVTAGSAVVVPTGGVVPEGADAVVPVELTERDGDRVLVMRALPTGKHLRPAGEDVASGDVVVGAGRRLRAPDLGVLAAAGLAEVEVFPRARIGIVSTGDELVRPPAPLADAQIYDSNAFTLIAASKEAEAIPVDGGPATDAPGALRDALDAVFDDVDLFVCSGGVSMGERDPVKRAFETDSDITFANVAMQPGRPQAFGIYRGKPFFGLPGNPISVYVSFEVFVRPALLKLMGRTEARQTVDATLDGVLEAPRSRTRFARVTVRREDGTYVAKPEGGHQSNLLATFAKADGLVEVEAGGRIEDGDPCRVRLIREV